MIRPARHGWPVEDLAPVRPHARKSARQTDNSSPWWLSGWTGRKRAAETKPRCKLNWGLLVGLAFIFAPWVLLGLVVWATR